MWLDAADPVDLVAVDLQVGRRALQLGRRQALATGLSVLKPRRRRRPPRVIEQLAF